MADGVKEILSWTDAGGAVHVVPVDIVSSHTDDRTAEVTSHPIEAGANINDHIIQQPDQLSLEIAQTQTPFPTPTNPGVYFEKPKGFSFQPTPLQVQPNAFAPIKAAQKLNVQPNAFTPGGLFAITQAAEGAVSAVANFLTGKSDDVFSPGPPARTNVETSPTVNVWAADSPVDRIGELHDALISIKANGRFCTVTFRGRIYPDYICTKVQWKTQKGEVGLGRFSLELQRITTVSTEETDLPDPASLRLKPVAKTAKPPKGVDDASAPKGSDLESLASKATGAGAR